MVLRKITEGVLRMIGMLHASIIMIPVTTLQLLLSIPQFIYHISGITKSLYIMLLCSSAVLLVCTPFACPNIPLVFTVGTALFSGGMLPLIFLTPALALRDSIKQCGEQFSHFSISEGILLPFDSLLTQWNTLRAFIPELNKYYGGSLACIFHRETASELRTCRAKQMVSLRLSTTAQIIDAQIEQHSSYFTQIASLLLLRTSKDLIPIFMGYLINKADIIAVITNDLARLDGKYQQAARQEYLHINQNGRLLTQEQQKKKLEVRVESEVDLNISKKYAGR